MCSCFSLSYSKTNKIAVVVLYLFIFQPQTIPGETFISCTYYSYEYPFMIKKRKHEWKMLSLSLTSQVFKKVEIVNKKSLQNTIICVGYISEKTSWSEDAIISQGEVTKKLKRGRNLQRVLINVLMKISPRVTAHILIVTFYSSWVSDGGVDVYTRPPQLSSLHYNCQSPNWNILCHNKQPADLSFIS